MLIPIDREAFLPLFVCSFFAGILFGVVYDIFRIRRISFRVPSFFSKKGKNKIASLFYKNLSVIDVVFVFFEDIIFSLFCTFVFILLNFKLNFGLPRWYSVAAAAVGFFLHYITLGKLIVKSAEKIIKFIIISFRFVFAYTITPILVAIKKLRTILNKNIKKKLNISYTKKYERQILSSISDINLSV